MPGINLLIIAFITGFGGLIYEIVLFKLLSIQLGINHTALAMVLSAYMAGLGLGTWYFGQVRSKKDQSVYILSISQVLSGVTILFLQIGLGLLDRFVIAFNVSVLLEHIVIFTVTMIPTFFMGGVIPLLYRISYATGQSRGRNISRIYGFNTIGSIVGVLIANFFLVPVLGLTLSRILAASFFLVVPLFLLFSKSPEFSVNTETKCDESSDSRCSSHFLIFLASITGFCGLALEVVWVRVLGTFLPNRNYSFGIILAIYLLGYSLGSLFAGRKLKKKLRTLQTFPVIFIILGFLSLNTVLVTHFTPEFMYHIRYIMVTSWRQMLLPPIITSFMMILPTTFFMGMVLPFLVDYYPGGVSIIGKDVGKLFSANILFSIVGSLVTGFLLLPSIGALRTSLIMSIIYSILGLLVLIRQRDFDFYKTFGLLIVAGILMVNFVGLIMPDILPKPLPVSVGREESRDDHLLFFKETAAGTITVVEDNRTGIRWSYINNSAVCGTTYDALKVVRVLAHLPMLAHPDPRQVLVIGFGLGVTAGNVLTYPVERVDCVELCPEVVEAAYLYESFNRNVLQDKRLSFIGGDGRRWLKRTEKNYDVITCDPTHPVLGSGNLYTVEYFELIKSRLTEYGVFVQYYPLRYLNTSELKQAIATFHQVFSYSYLWLGYSHGVMLGSMQPLTVDTDRWQLQLSRNPARYDLQKSSLSRIYDWLAIVMMGPEELEKYCSDVAPVYDDKPVLEYPSFDSLHPFTWTDNMASISQYRNVELALKLVSQPLIDENVTLVLKRFYQAKSLLIKGSIERGLGNSEKALNLYFEARKTNWDDTEIRRVHQFLQEQIGSERKRKYLGQ